jgi:hypothetical protein
LQLVLDNEKAQSKLRFSNSPTNAIQSFILWGSRRSAATIYVDRVAGLVPEKFKHISELEETSEKGAASSR